MERHFNGSSECPQHGVFNWKGYVLENDFTVGKWDDLCQNCGEISLINGEYHIPTICPHCHCTVWVVEKE